ncbi:hypothetical protein L1887_18072 [Cichorium endivia]|nr:hypothetical protein L1887_18072 [Cichorium endivia]
MAPNLKMRKCTSELYLQGSLAYPKIALKVAVKATLYHLYSSAILCKDSFRFMYFVYKYLSPTPKNTAYCTKN